MTDRTYQSCARFLQNRDTVRSVFPWEGGAIHACCAGVYISREQAAHPDDLDYCKRLIRDRVGLFSSFRGAILPPLAALLDVSGTPDNTLEWGLWFYEELKEYFMTSQYLPLAAMILARLAPAEGYEELAVRTRALYNGMKAEHPMLTGQEDSAYCALMSLSAKSDGELYDDMEGCYHMLRPHFFSANAVQSLSHALAVCEGTPEDKCTRTLDLYYMLRDGGRRYGGEYELPTLGVLAQAAGDLGQAADAILDIDGWLKAQPGFGFFGPVTAAQRLMYAGMLAQRDWLDPDAMDTAAVSGTMALIIAQQVAAVSAIAAASAARNASTAGG